MKRLSLLLLVISTLNVTETTLAQYSSTRPLEFLCGANPDSFVNMSELSLDEDTLGLLVIVARGWGDCFGQGNDLRPGWADSLLSPTYQGSLTRYYDDNSRGRLHFQGIVARPP